MYISSLKTKLEIIVHLFTKHFSILLLQDWTNSFSHWLECTYATSFFFVQKKTNKWNRVIFIRDRNTLIKALCNMFDSFGIIYCRNRSVIKTRSELNAFPRRQSTQALTNRFSQQKRTFKNASTGAREWIYWQCRLPVLVHVNKKLLKEAWNINSLNNVRLLFHIFSTRLLFNSKWTENSILKLKTDKKFRYLLYKVIKYYYVNVLCISMYYTVLQTYIATNRYKLQPNRHKRKAGNKLSRSHKSPEPTDRFSYGETILKISTLNQGMNLSIFWLNRDVNSACGQYCFTVNILWFPGVGSEAYNTVKIFSYEVIFVLQCMYCVLSYIVCRYEKQVDFFIINFKAVSVNISMKWPEVLHCKQLSVKSCIPDTG